MLDDLDWGVVLDDPGRSMLLSGLGVTLQLTLLTVTLAFVLGLLVAVGRTTTSPYLAPLRWLLASYVEFFRNVPLLVQLFFWSFGVFTLEAVRFIVSPLNGWFSNQFIAGVLAMSVYGSTFIAEVIRSGITSVPKGQLEAGLASGLPRSTVMARIILPQALRTVVPAIGNEFFTITKNTSLVMVIGVTDLVFRGNELEVLTYRPFEAYTGVMVLYSALCFAELAVLELLKRRRRRAGAPRPAAAAMEVGGGR